MAVLRIAAAAWPAEPPSVWTMRHPEWWSLAISGFAWLVLMVGGPDNATALCTRTPQSPLPGALFGWVAMTLAMMPPLVVLSVRHVGFRSIRGRRHIAIAEFLAGYLGVWLATGTVLLVVFVAADAALVTTDRRLVTILAYGATMLWQFTPMKRRALWRCHRAVPLAMAGWRADLSCLRFGIGAGRDCLSSCWLLMTLPLVSPHSAASMICVQMAMLHERYQRARYPRRGPSVLLLSGAFALSLSSGLV